MLKTLYLREDERQLFSALPRELREGWEVGEETLRYEDSDYKRAVRLEMVRLKSPELRKLQERAKGAQTQEEFLKIAETLDLSKVSETDLHQLLFGLGPDVLAMFVADALSRARTDEDVQAVAALTQLRHIYLDSLLSASQA